MEGENLIDRVRSFGPRAAIECHHKGQHKTGFVILCPEPGFVWIEVHDGETWIVDRFPIALVLSVLESRFPKPIRFNDS